MELLYHIQHWKQHYKVDIIMNWMKNTFNVFTKKKKKTLRPYRLPLVNIQAMLSASLLIQKKAAWFL